MCGSKEKVFIFPIWRKTPNSDIFRHHIHENEVVEFITQWEQRCRNICARIFRILPRFLANQNLWGCVFTPASYTTDSSQCQKNQCL